MGSRKKYFFFRFFLGNLLKLGMGRGSSSTEHFLKPCILWLIHPTPGYKPNCRGNTGNIAARD